MDPEGHHGIPFLLVQAAGELEGRVRTHGDPEGEGQHP